MRELEAEGLLERVMGIEPTFLAWEANVLPLNYTRAEERILMGRSRCGKRRARRPGVVVLSDFRIIDEAVAVHVLAASVKHGLVHPVFTANLVVEAGLVSHQRGLARYVGDENFADCLSGR